MSPRARSPTAPARYLTCLHAVADAVALPHGYTLLLWCTTMVTIERHGLPDLVSVLCLLAGACIAYLGVGRLGGARRDTDEPLKRAHRIAAGNFVTLALATLACALAALIPIVFLAWLVVGFVGTSVYLLGCAAQAYLATRRTRPSADD